MIALAFLAASGGGVVPYRSGAPDAGVDAGLDGGWDAGVPEPVPPAPPSLPADPLAGGTFLPCAAGFRPREEPVGPPSCEPDPDACPAGDFAEDAPEGAIDVRLGVDSLADAIAAAEEGAVLRLSKGEVAEAVSVDRPITLWGACAAETVLSGAVTLAEGARIRSLTAGGVSVAAGVEVALVESVNVTGVTSVSGTLAASDLHGGLLDVTGGAQLERASFDGVTLRGSDARIDARGILSPEVDVLEGAYLVALDLVVSVVGLTIDPDSRADVARGHFFAPVSIEHGTFVGIDVTGTSLGSISGSVGLTRARLGAGIALGGSSNATLTDLTLEGVGLVATGAIQLVRCSISASSGTGLLVFEPYTSVEGTDVAILSPSSYGIVAEDLEAIVDLDRVRVESARGAGVVAFGGAVMRLRDVVVEPTLLDGEVGAGIASIDGASVDVTGFRVSAAGACGVQVAQKGGMDLHDGEVSGNPVGACVPPDATQRLQDHVTYRDNGEDFDGAVRPIPVPIEGS